jgi:hypothetical protein
LARQVSGSSSEPWRPSLCGRDSANERNQCMQEVHNASQSGHFGSCHCQAGVWQQQPAVASLLLRQGLCDGRMQVALGSVVSRQCDRFQEAAASRGAPPFEAATLHCERKACSRCWVMDYDNGAMLQCQAAATSHDAPPAEAATL